MSRAKVRFTRTNPPLPTAIPNLFQVTVFGNCEGAGFNNVFYYADGNAGLVAATEQNLSAGWITAYLTQYRACLSSDATVTAIKVQCLTSPNRIPYVAQIASGAGTGPAGHAPMNVAVTLIRQTGIKGQSGRGRVNMPAVPATWIAQSRLTTTGAHVAFAGLLNTGFVASAITYTAQLVSRHNLKTGPFPPALGASPILTASADFILGSSRKRKINR